MKHLMRERKRVERETMGVGSLCGSIFVAFGGARLY
jgi:hypothetical protein